MSNAYSVQTGELEGRWRCCQIGFKEGTWKGKAQTRTREVGACDPLVANQSGQTSCLLKRGRVEGSLRDGGTGGQTPCAATFTGDSRGRAVWLKPADEGFKN